MPAELSLPIDRGEIGTRRAWDTVSWGIFSHAGKGRYDYSGTKENRVADDEEYPSSKRAETSGPGF